MSQYRTQSGFILLAALGVLAIVGVAMLTLAAASVYDGQRTFDRARHAQLDQMLLAAATQAVEHLKSASPKTGDSWQIELPDALTEQDGKLTANVESAESGEVWLKIHAQLANRSAE